MLFGLVMAMLHAQSGTGELRLQVVDASGQPLAASGVLSSAATQSRFEFTADDEGRKSIARVPFGRYQLSITAPGFSPYSELIEIRSAAPVRLRVVLNVAPLATTIDVTEDATLLDPRRVGAVQRVGPETLARRESSLPGRGGVDIVNLQTGWLLEANGVLHPRGSEYGVQYVVDGSPLIDNRSPAFAPALGVTEFESVAVRTGGYPAEYGRQLGGVVELETVRDLHPGWHGSLSMQEASFATRNGSAFVQYARGNDTFGANATAMETDRYLDPPVQENYSNHASGNSAAFHWDRDWNASNRTRASARYGRTGFLVPNERVQQAAGQRQDRTSGETAGQLAHTSLLNPATVVDARVAVRDITARLWSNLSSIPIEPFQDRGFRETYASVSISRRQGRHELKAGADALFRSIREQFSYRITAYTLGGVRVFDRDTPASFYFADRGQDREQSGYVQDLMRLGAVTLSAGLRWDHYSLIAHESAWSPRIAAAWETPAHGLTLRASYDRVFQTPATENLLLSSSAAVQMLNDSSVYLLLRPSRGNYYEAGFSKSIFGKARLDGSWFRRSFRNFADDSLLLNTGVSFPIAFSSAEIHGFEAKLEIPRWGPLSGFLGYTNLLGRGRLPIAGGLFLEDSADQLLNSTDQFAITQDQRNTARARLRIQITSRVWAGAGAQYGSGLPVELGETPDTALLLQQYGPAVLERVNFARGRVRPSSSLDLSAGTDLLRRERWKVRVQGDVMNVTDRLNVINFAGLFSGTALDAPRWGAVRLEMEF